MMLFLALHTAESFVIQHPGLFEQVVLMQKNDADLLAVGREALQKFISSILSEEELLL